ncbi:Transport and golgi organization 2-like protein [Thalictrum thalictroides]|uniref:Transport and golgi organization 2-like protein n=1 Tax=Thalictrum thalictroides TaxID=46969 RepID=A0A7J6VJB7_THATH|nr:Transport and golgi organization 2-like protein [Thalictrum thalictroides]
MDVIPWKEEGYRMCITVFIWQAHPLYPFLLLFNRDEFHNRPTKPVSWWEDNEILGGRDEVAGGTWLACTRQGRIAFLTNVREVSSLPEAKSRGELVLGFLQSKKRPMEFANEVLKEVDQYNGFNLVLCDLCSKTMVYVCNRPKGEPLVQVVSPGIHVLSNARLDTPWQKSQRLGQNFKELMDKHSKDEIPVKLIAEELMTDTTKADKNSLPGIHSFEWEYITSSIFIDQFVTSMGSYGTVSTSALSVKPSGELSFYEKYLSKEEWKEYIVNFLIDKMEVEREDDSFGVSHFPS